MKDKIIAFFQDVVKEMKKVTWPTKAELLESTFLSRVVPDFTAVLLFLFKFLETVRFGELF